MYERILIVVAHPDDEVYGMGGSIVRATEVGSKVKVLYVTEGTTSIDRNARLRTWKSGEVAELLGICETQFLNLADQRLDTYPRLDITNMISEVVKEFEPETVYTHCHEDLNLDHRIVHECVMVACRPNKSTVKALLTFKVTDSDYGEFGNWQPNLFSDVSQYGDKVRAALELYGVPVIHKNVETFKLVYGFL